MWSSVRRGVGSRPTGNQVAHEMARARWGWTDRGPARSRRWPRRRQLPIPMGKAGGGGIGLIILLVVYLLHRRRAARVAAAASGSTPVRVRCRNRPEPTEAELDEGAAGRPRQVHRLRRRRRRRDLDEDLRRERQDLRAADHRPLRQQVRTACGNAPSTVGPFYCPNDRKVYLDITFMNELQQRLGAQGDFAQAYIVAHEIGHHVQNLLGVMEDVDLAQQEDPETPTTSRSGSSCRPTASPASGRTPPSARRTCSRPATSRRR